MSLITEYPAWFVIFCIALGLLYAGILYYKNRREEFSVATQRWLAVFRFIAVFIISFLLLSPLVKTVFHKTEKPLIIFAQDNTESIAIGKDSGYYRNDYQAAFKDAVDDLSKDYNVRTYSFGDKVTEGLNFDFDEKQTDISALFDEMAVRYSNRNVGAMVLATDGVYNHGLNPVYGSDELRFPVYTVALGDTAIRRDVFISKVNFNRIAFLGNEFPVEVIVGANRSKGLQSTLSVIQKGKVLYSTNIRFKSDQYFETKKFTLKAGEAGLQRYTIRLSTVEDEISTVNNSQDIFIDVLDSKQKILLLAAAPHPDVSAIKSAIESNYNYEVTESVIGDFTGQIESFNMVVMHQLPSGNTRAASLIQKAREKKIPLLFVVGTKTDLVQFNTLNTGVKIITNQVNFNEALPVLNSDFTLFTISETAAKAFENFPPLLAPFGDYQTLNSTTSLFYQQIGSLETSYPLVAFNRTLDEKTGIIAGEGLWKWRLQDFLKNGNHNAFDEVMTKMVQFLSVNVDKSFFRVEGEHNFLENEPVIFDAEVYNQSYELINSMDVEMTITNSKGDKYPFAFGKTANAYQLNAGILPVDNYTWEARVRVGDNLYTDNGAFTVSPLNIEAVNTIADHNLLYQLSKKTNGEMIYPSQLSELPGMIRNRADITSITYTDRKYSDLVNIPWIFGLILLMLTVEWFIRKRGGSY